MVIPLLACGVVFLSGCVPLRVTEFDRDCSQVKVPGQWQVQGAYEIADEAVSGWVSDFNSPLLERLAREAVKENFSIAAARERIFQAEELARSARANLFPLFDAGQSSTRSQTLSPAGQVQTKRHSLSLSMSWELDLWRRIHDLKESRVATMDAQYHAYQSAKLSLVANVIKTVFELVEAQEQIELAERNLESLRTNLKILDTRLVLGDADDRTALEISLSRSDIARAEANVVSEEIIVDRSRRTLEILLGRYPEGTIKGIDALPDPKRCVPIGLPSDLLMRRPDILQAELLINSAIYNLSAERKQLLPSLSLTGDVGTSSTEAFPELFDLDNLVWNITRNLTQPVFEGGRIRSEIRLAEHEKDELIASYADLVLSAFNEVEFALAAETYFDRQVEAFEENVAQADLAESLSLSNYEEGIVEILTLLESQRRAFDARSSLLNIRLQRALNRVDLYLALGGDFETRPKCTPIPADCHQPAGKVIDWLQAGRRPSGDWKPGRN